MPRRRLSRRDRRFLRAAQLALGSASLIVGIILLSAGGWRLLEERRIARDYKPSDATVIDTQTETRFTQLPTPDVPGMGRETFTERETLWLLVKYKAERKVYARWVAVSDRHDFRPRATYPCWYDPSHPTAVVLERDPELAARAIAAGGLALGIVGMIASVSAPVVWRNRAAPSTA